VQAPRKFRLYDRHIIRTCILVVSFHCAFATKTGGTQDVDNSTCTSSSPAATDQNPVATFRISTQNKERVLIIEGIIDPYASPHLASFIKSSLPIDEIWLNSPGGIASEGLALGRVIRSFGIPTRIPSGWRCVSACSMAFLGGPIRRIDAGGIYSVHMFALGRTRGTNADSKEPSLTEMEQISAISATEQNNFLIQMGVSRKLLSEVIYRQKSSGIRCMTRQEEKQYNIVNVK
jgi:hypothetical protein